MSEYMESFSVSRLIGAPPGYVGYDEGGQLTEAIRRKPYSIVLFDEIEKAHPEVFNLLLQILDDGRLTDNQGRTVDFKNTIIIMTSNLGSDLLTDNSESGKAKVMTLVKQSFKPEFVNRIDEIVLFNPLDKPTQTLIVRKMLNDLANRLKSQNLLIDFTEAVNQAVIENAFDPEYGARPLKRYLQHTIETDIAKKIIGGEIKPHVLYQLDYVNNEFVIRTA
ncbi:MAG: AAA domain-containing protein, partial [Acholeplasmataceae bacterium]|nr:AAA domain-containing protein [Acholeplasmataceae bacterium]